jgi:N6-L-threonylcarbamoyladenine synthase
VKILGIETSCDETAAAVVEDGVHLLSNTVVSQIDIHREFGGVVPEVAARSHIEVIIPVIDKALADAKCTWRDIDAIGVTRGPGLIGSLLIGTLTARTLSLLKEKPLYGVHHVLGHVYANWLIKPLPKFPVLALIVSGGHSQLVLFRDHFDYQLLGQTRDDAVGEAYDKVAKVLGLPYPGGPSVDKAAKTGDAKSYDFPDARLDSPYDFSFSGLKTAVLRRAQAEIGQDYSFPSHEIAPHLSPRQVADLAAGFQRAAVNTMVSKTIRTYEEYQPNTVVIAGGVAANLTLREELAQALPISVHYAPIELCTDNAAMVASLAYFQSRRQKPDEPYSLTVDPSLTI